MQADASRRSGRHRFRSFRLRVDGFVAGTVAAPPGGVNEFSRATPSVTTGRGTMPGRLGHMSAPRHTDLLIVGGGVAAARCACAMRRGGFGGSILLVGDEPLPPYNRPPLSKELLALDDAPDDDLLLAEPPAWYARRGVELLTSARVAEVDAEARTASITDDSRIGFDRCVLATGAAPRPLAVPGGEHAFLLRTASDARRLRAAIDAAAPGDPVVVVGGGFIGVEVAAALAARGLRATLVARGAQLWNGQLGTLMAAWAAAALGDAGVELRLGAMVSRVEVNAVWLGSERLPARFVVAGVGVAPRVELATVAGIVVEDGIRVDDSGRTSHPGVWAAGDVARIAGRRRSEHWHAAREGGERAAGSLLGDPPLPPPPAWVFSEVGGVSIDVVGSLDADASVSEAWLSNGAVAALRDGVVVGVASIAGAIDPRVARQAIADARPPGWLLTEVHRAAT